MNVFGTTRVLYCSKRISLVSFFFAKKELVLVRTISIRGKKVWLSILLKPSVFEAGIVSIKKPYNISLQRIL